MTDKDLMQEALDALTYVGNKDIYSDTIDALRAKLATCDRCGRVNPPELHTCTPKQREWVGLTDEERILCEVSAKQNYVTFANAIEAKLKEKNSD